MLVKTIIWLSVALILAPNLRAEDSLKSALNAVNRRQRDLSEYRSADYDNYGFARGEDGDNIAFLKHTSEEGYYDLERALLDYLEKRDVLDNQEPTEERPSLFRERMEKDRHRKNMEEAFLQKLYAEEMNNEEEQPRAYYKYPQPHHKRSYNTLGWNSVGMRKRSRYFQPDVPNDSLYLLNYAPRDEVLKRLEEEQGDSEADFDFLSGPKERKSYRYSNPAVYKRFPVSKRSGNAIAHQHKRSPNDKEPLKTDPKVEKDLTNIFNANAVKSASTAALVKPTEGPKSISKEEVPLAAAAKKPIEVKKKSINWSDYFGLDRRKKMDKDGSEWFVRQYQQAAAQAQKRSDYPLKIFHEQAPVPVNTSKEAKIREMDEKLKTIEESIVDDTLKFTGAHEDAVDTKEVQEVKDKIISRLAAAYNLEKMRLALRDFADSLSKQKGAGAQDADIFVSEQKRIAVPRKQAIDEQREAPDESNDIKCTDKDENCDEQNYKPPSEILEETIWPKGNCPKIAEACTELLPVLGPYWNMLETACSMYQTCLLCGDNTWYNPTRQCNTLFLIKTESICQGNVECQRVARQSLKYLLQVNQSLKNQQQEERPLHETCQLECPDK